MTQSHGTLPAIWRHDPDENQPPTSMKASNSSMNPLFAVGMTCLLALNTFSKEADTGILQPYTGPSIRGTDPTTLEGKVMTGYQGWFNCEGDGADLGWTHWAKNRRQPFAPDNIGVDMWPDVSEFADDELYETGFLDDRGTPATVFSSYDRRTVLRHFQWMQQYGIDGAFIQRFANGLNHADLRHHKDMVLSSAREGANRHGRTYSVMYDLSGIREGAVETVFSDWRMLRQRMEITDDPAYQHHEGKPLVTIWGVGFKDDAKRRPDLQAGERLIRKLKADGCSIMLGIPTGWRTRERDALTDDRLHEVLLLADILSPWSVGRFGNLKGVQRHAKNHWAPDIIWAKEHSITYMPVVFPGFSWHNQNKGELNAIPRLKGRFMWDQVLACREAGASMIYVAMFDEVDEGTAIFKCTDTPPTGNGARLLGMEGLPSDHYLRLAEKAGQLIRGEISPSKAIPE
ncbi:glycoside hydrolase family 71/99-like protein [Haloferula rosea]|uniref:Xylosidase/arabinosidase n=1 Tax=Haloferula rosea TaxID=490093 RepID=A0A934VEB2_9BACT|nr:glycoside hydrolase family 71/99-like protein [Haloferula rosea]MBK1825871.1 xylosidase/arabinosidase [Haloferula rosea]